MSAYLKRLVEQVLTVFVAAALPVLMADGIGKAALVGAVAAGLRALYGLVVKPVGDAAQPSAVK